MAKFIIIFVPVYLAMLYYIYLNVSKQISELKEERSLLLSEKDRLERKIESLAKDITIQSVEEIKKIKVSPMTRLGDKYGEVSESISKFQSLITDLKVKNENTLDKELKELIPKPSEDLNKKLKALETAKDELEIIEKEVDEKGNGPTRNSTINEQIAQSEEARNNLLYLTSKGYEYYQQRSAEFQKTNKTLSDTENKFEQYFDLQWEINEKIALKEKTVSELEHKINQINTNMIEKSEDSIQAISDQIMSRESFDDLRTDEVEKLLEKSFGVLKRNYDTISSSKNEIFSSNIINFAHEVDYNLLHSHFSKKFGYKRLVSMHDKLTKEFFDKQLAGRKNLFIYVELESKRRIGFYMEKAFPKKTLLPKSFKDENSAIFYFNNNEIYRANPETQTHYRTDTDYLFIIGNTQNNDGIWFTVPKPKTKDIAKAVLGMRTNEFILGRTTLFGNIVTDNISTFEVFQLTFDDK